MTPKQARFVEEYLVDLNATQAAIRAGYSARTAYSAGQRLLKHVEAASAVETALAERSRRTAITADRVVQELARIGFADLRKAVKWRANVVGMHEDEDGVERLAITNQVQLVDSDDLDDDTAAAIAEIAQTDKGALRIKLHDKQAALVSLGKHLGIFGDETPSVNVNVGVAVIDTPPQETREQWLARKAQERALVDGRA